MLSSRICWVSYPDTAKAFEYERICMAWHEASHVICGLHNYLYIPNTSIMTVNNREGNTNYDLPELECSEDEEVFRILLIFELQAIYAGWIGERLYYKEICGSDNFPLHLRIGSSFDIGLASQIIRKYKLANPGKKTFILKKQIQFDVEQVLLRHWESVKLVAHALCKRRKLNFQDLKLLLTKKGNNTEFWKERFKQIKVVHSGKLELLTVKEVFLTDSIFDF